MSNTEIAMQSVKRGPGRPKKIVSGVEAVDAEKAPLLMKISPIVAPPLPPAPKKKTGPKPKPKDGGPVAVAVKKEGGDGGDGDKISSISRLLKELKDMGDLFDALRRREDFVRARLSKLVK